MSDAVFLSASIPDPKRHPEFAQTADSVAISSAVAALLYVTLGRRRLIWGGHPAITPMVIEMCENIDVEYSAWVTLYQSKFFEDQYPEDNKRFGNVIYVDRSADGTRSTSLASMRERMLSDSEYFAGVFIGGMQGILDEAALLQKLQPRAKCIPVATTGGAALQLASLIADLPEDLKHNMEYVGLFHEVLHVDEREQRYRHPGLQPDNIQSRFRFPGA